MKTVVLFFLLLILLPVALVSGDLLPAIPPDQERVLLLPVVFCFGVLALPRLPALLFALATALVQGLLLMQIQAGQADFGLAAPMVFFLCWTIVLQMAGEAARGIRWEIHALGSFFVTLTLLAGEFLILCVKRGGFPVGMTVALRIGIPAVAALLIAPLVYLLLRSLVPMASAATPLTKAALDS
jgi:hypothetical protein